MATIVAAPLDSLARIEDGRAQKDGRAGLVLTSVLSLFAFAVHGYHPFVEDGGLYAAGIKYLLDPTLYPHGREFVTAHLHYSVFAMLMAGAVRVTGVGLETALLCTYIGSLWATLYAGWMLARRCFRTMEECAGAMLLLASWMTLPVAGTSLMLMDPYVTARSVSTPLSLMALAGVMDLVRWREEDGRAVPWRSGLLCAAPLGLGLSFHPLMAGYGVCCAVALWGAMQPERRSRRRWGLALVVSAIAGAAVVQWVAPGESATYVRAEMTRPYWFLSEWAWYEWMGVIAPVTMLLVASALSSGREMRAMARMCVLTAAMATAVALLFGREGLHAHLVARMQPMRLLQVSYVAMILLLGGLLGGSLLRRRPWRWAAAAALLGGSMAGAGCAVFPCSPHVELPKSETKGTRRSPWVAAFVWIRENTPKDALFALDARYITRDGEDAQCFRAVAERSSLPDYSKDGGEAAITPALAGAWAQGQAAQTGLSRVPDGERVARLRPLGVGWVVLPQDAETGFRCEYSNGAVKVCTLP